jgi:hypothetical protein
MKKTTLLLGLSSAYLLYKVNQMGYFNTNQEVSNKKKQNSSSFKLMFLIYLIVFCWMCIPKILKYLKDKYSEACMSCSFSTCFQCDIGETTEEPVDIIENKKDIKNIDRTFITKDLEGFGDTKDVKISSESLGSGNVIVYKIITDKELDDNFLNFDEEDDTPNITINKITKPINKENNKINKGNRTRKLNKRKVEIIIDKSKNKDIIKSNVDTENINNDNKSIITDSEGVKCDSTADYVTK